MQSILIVDDDEAFGERLARAMRARGLTVSLAQTGKKAIALANLDSPELAVVDLRVIRTSSPCEPSRSSKTVAASRNGAGVCAGCKS